MIKKSGKGRRPCAHVRRVRTKKGVKKKLINPRIPKKVKKVKKGMALPRECSKYLIREDGFAKPDQWGLMLGDRLFVLVDGNKDTGDNSIKFRDAKRRFKKVPPYLIFNRATVPNPIDTKFKFEPDLAKVSEEDTVVLLKALETAFKKDPGVVDRIFLD